MELTELIEWRKAKYGSQGSLAAELGCTQTMVSRYEQGKIPIPAEIELKLRDLGFTGQLRIATKPLKSLVEIDFHAILVSAEKIISEIEKEEGRPIPPVLRSELLPLVGDEIQVATQQGSPDLARVRVMRWWALIRGTR